MKTPLPLAIVFALTSCVKFSAPDAVTDVKSAGSKITGPITRTQPAVRVKNHNQYNMTLEKLTGLHRAKYNSLFDAVKGSLPADNDIGGLTAFNLIAMTRLADAYCGDFVEKEDSLGLSDKLSPMRARDVRDFLLGRFLDVGSDEEKYASLKDEVDNVLANDDGGGERLFPNATTDKAGNKQLAVAACVAILASSHITLLE